jgi:hypothetical protein
MFEESVTALGIKELWALYSFLKSENKEIKNDNNDSVLITYTSDCNVLF